MPQPARRRRPQRARWRAGTPRRTSEISASARRSGQIEALAQPGPEEKGNEELGEEEPAHVAERAGRKPPDDAVNYHVGGDDEAGCGGRCRPGVIRTARDQGRQGGERKSDATGRG